MAGANPRGRKAESPVNRAEAGPPGRKVEASAMEEAEEGPPEGRTEAPEKRAGPPEGKVSRKLVAVYMVVEYLYQVVILIMMMKAALFH
jgi:hypothetical protein